MIYLCRFPGQEFTSGSQKIPSVMYYNKAGKMMSAGAESLADDVIEKAAEEGWLKVQWYAHEVLRTLFIHFNMTC